LIIIAIFVSIQAPSHTTNIQAKKNQATSFFQVQGIPSPIIIDCRQSIMLKANTIGA
jgi:hypothetical protein